ncbi:MAG: tetratricopeptide repeat protein [Akkermansiaceae bacterium]|nr:tetratricopeptide repeat protein [Akkermansiaceae bacterium]
MKQLITAILATTVYAAMAGPALAQADAQQAYQQAQTAYQAGKFDEACELAERATQTDPGNPEVFLLLGKAQYQRGRLEAAMAAWSKTLSLAPGQPFAARMLDMLRAERVEVDTRIKLVEVMIGAKLLAEAQRESGRLLGEKALSETQRAKVLLLQAETALLLGSPEECQAKIEQLRVLYPKQLDPVQATLLAGRAKLQSGGAATLEGITTLRKLVADHPGTPAAATGRYALIAFELRQGANPARARALAKWLTESPGHPQVGEALRALIDAYLSVSRQGAKPTPESELSKWDVDALALADELYKQTPQAEEARKLTELLLKHLDEHYAGNGAYAAAIQGVQTQQQVELPRPSRLLILQALARYQTAIATRQLDEQARIGKLPAVGQAGALPQRLADVVAVYDLINRDFPDHPAWAEQVKLAVAVRSFTAKVIAPPPVKALMGPDAWAWDIAQPVLQANADTAAVKSAVEMAQGIIHDYAQCDNIAGRKLAVELSSSLSAALAPTDAAALAVIGAHAERLDGYARLLFNENIKTGNDTENARLSDVQKALLETLQQHIAREASYATAALDLLGKHLEPWLVREHWAVAEEAYTTLATALPEQARRQAELAVVQLWIRQVAGRDKQLTAAGFSVPRQLDPILEQALRRCYQLQAGIDAASAELVQVRGVWDSILQHYRALEFDDVVEVAIKIKAEPAVEAADEYAQYTLAREQELMARRELALRLTQYGANENLALGPAFAQAIAAYVKFVTDRPASPLVPQASERVFGIGRLFEQQEAFGVAAEVYQSLAKFAVGIKLLAQSAPEQSSPAERAAFAMANALDLAARKALAKANSLRQGDTPPPAKLSTEFAAAIAAYKAFIAANPESRLVGDATTKVMAVASEYAKIDAWDVADAVYADLLASELKIRRPERIEFARGLCQLGRAMPDHAREVLAMLTSSGLRGSGAEVGEAMLAAVDRDESDRLADPFAGPTSTARPAATKPPPRPEPSGAATAPAEPNADAGRDVQLLAMIRRQESNSAARVAQLREQVVFNAPLKQDAQQIKKEQAAGQQAEPPIPPVPVLSEAELARQDQALAAAYGVFQGIRKQHPHTPTAEQARAEIMVMIGHWRGLQQWERSAALAVTFLADNANDRDLPKLRLELARDRLAWAAKPLERKTSKQEMLVGVSKRFDLARAALAKIVADFPGERSYQQQAQWDIASSFLTQARVVNEFSPTLARGQYVRTTRELRQVAVKHPEHPRISEIPQLLWSIAAELEGRGYNEEAILVWNELTIHDSMHDLAQQAALKIAQMYHQKLKRPLRAAEAYQELNFARGGSDTGLQDAIFQIGSELKGQKRWVEALHVLETFVDSFPRHPSAGAALTMAGQIHQANEAWEDAIAAYRRVIVEFDSGQFVQDAKWAIADCTINLSQWRQASDAYRDYVQAYPKDEKKVAEATRRIEVLKDLSRYQGLVDEKGQRKAFDAQHQIAVIVGTQLNNPVKAIIEYRKVVKGWPQSHLADDALYAVGTTFLSLGETGKAREALLAVASQYPSSPLADDAVFMVGKSYEDEADRLATVTREKSLEQAKDIAQKHAYEQAQSGRRAQQEVRDERITKLRQGGKGKEAENEEAARAANYGQFNIANVKLFAQRADQEVETLTATQLADRQDKINAALRQAVVAYTTASKVAGADKADDALLQMATIYDQRLKDSQEAMRTWLEIVRQFSGTAVAEDASWRIARYYEQEAKHAEAIEAYQAFLRSYRRSPNAGAAQFAVAENYEHLNRWVEAMDSYTNYITNFPEGPLLAKAKDQINWIKTYRL